MHLRNSNRQFITLVHPISCPYSRNGALALADAGFLKQIVTSFTYSPHSSLGTVVRYLPSSLSTPVQKELSRRVWSHPQNIDLINYPLPELTRVFIQKTGLDKFLGISREWLSEWVSTSLSRNAAQFNLEGLQGVYAYENCALDVFLKAKQQGIKCFYDLPIAFCKEFRSIFEEEVGLFSHLLPNYFSSPNGLSLDRKVQELELADHVFVPSTFVLKSVAKFGVHPKNISVNTFGAPVDYFNISQAPKPRFQALFVGRLGLRKGVHYLLSAWQQLKLQEAELLLVGINEFPDDWFAKQLSEVKNLRFIPSIPHTQLQSIYSGASVFVFPSLIEGLALVQLEAMACGVPLITTANAGGDDIITDGVEGFIIPIRDVEALKEKLEWCYQHPEELAEMGRAARRRAEQLTWESYRIKLASKVKELLGLSCESHH